MKSRDESTLILRQIIIAPRSLVRISPSLKGCLRDCHSPEPLPPAKTLMSLRAVFLLVGRRYE